MKFRRGFSSPGFEQGGDSEYDLAFHRMADAIATRMAKREHGDHYEGYESDHWAAAQDYARAALASVKEK